MEAVQTDFGIKEVLNTLGIKDINSGASTGKHWFATRGEKIGSYSPVDGSLIAEVNCATEAEYEAAILKGQDAFKEWRMWPATW